jgi:murein DD-endopeptidase MepM/ murein hydrolase activator NlpD
MSLFRARPSRCPRAPRRNPQRPPARPPGPRPRSRTRFWGHASCGAACAVFTRIVADGAFGAKTERAVRRLQKRLGLSVTGVVDSATFAKLGVRVRISKSGATPAPAPPTGDYPLAGPNAASAKYLKVFPVAGKHRYSNDFGAPRSQGGHQGNDIMADRGTPLRAVADGTVARLTRSETGLGGLWVWLEDTAGNDYYYAHMDTVAADLAVGTSVKAGHVLGGVGNTGDARYGAPHLHFEIHPGGGSAINPYMDLLAVDPEPPTG